MDAKWSSLVQDRYPEPPQGHNQVDRATVRNVFTCYSTNLQYFQKRSRIFLQHHHGAFFHHCPALHRVLGGRERPRSADNADFPRCGRRLGTAPPVRPRMHDNHDSLAGVCAFGVAIVACASNRALPRAVPQFRGQAPSRPPYRSPRGLSQVSCSSPVRCFAWGGVGLRVLGCHRDTPAMFWWARR